MKTLEKLIAISGAVILLAGIAQCGNDTTNPVSDMAMFGTPTVTGVTPLTAINNAPTPLTVTGTNFRTGVTVQVGGVACAQVNVVSPTQLTCIYPGNPNACGGQSIVVTSSDDQTNGTLAAEAGLNLTSASLFFAATNFPIPPHGIHSSIAVGDFNGDQKLDIASTSTTDVSVLLNNGLGDFGAPTNFPISLLPQSIALGDFNLDQKPDLAIANLEGQVNVLLGNGTGGFAYASNVLVGFGYNPSCVAVGDFNGDQKPDLAVANNYADSVSVLLGNGMGGFGAPTNFPVGRNPSFVLVDDFNGDGQPDLAVTNSGSRTVSVLLGNEMGGFGSAANFSVGRLPKAIAVGDFNGDQKPDLVTANGQGTVSVLLGDETGGFAVATDLPVGGAPSSVAVGDANGNYGSPYIDWLITTCRSSDHGYRDYSAAFRSTT